MNVPQLPQEKLLQVIHFHTKGHRLSGSAPIKASALPSYAQPSPRWELEPVSVGNSPTPPGHPPAVMRDSRLIKTCAWMGAACSRDLAFHCRIFPLTILHHPNAPWRMYMSMCPISIDRVWGMPGSFLVASKETSCVESSAEN